MNAERNLVAIAILAFGLRLAYAAASGELRAPQVWETEEIATNLVEHHEFTFDYDAVPYRAYIEPLYPFVAAGVYLVTNHSLTAMVVLQLLIAALTVWLLGRVAMLASGRGDVGVAAALLMAVHPGFIRYSCILHPLVFDAFFFVAAAGAIVRYRQLPTLRQGLIAAAIIGFGVLTRPTILLFLLPLIWIAWRTNDSLKTRLMRSAAVIAVTLAVVAPWTIRNAIVLHHFVLTRSGTGFVFWLGNNPASTGSAIDRAGRPIAFLASPELRKRVAAADELTRDRMYRQAATDYIRRDPGAAVVRVVQRLGYFWWFSPEWGLHYSTKLKIVYISWWTLLLGLWAAGAVVCRRFDVWLLSAMAFLISIGQSLFYVEGRHRLSVEALILPMAALGALWLLEIARNQIRRSVNG